MTRLLLTNDDGIDSPALLPTYRALRDLFDDVTIVVPSIERSWIGKAITRHGELEVTEHQREGVTIHAVSGYPADCTQLGLFHLADTPADLVVSGINIGANHSTAFAAGSGTLGAAIEASLAGVPGLAFSATSSRENFAEWNAAMRESASTLAWENLASAIRSIVIDVRDNGLPPDVDILTINLPETTTDATPHRVTPLGETEYGSLFGKKRPGVYEHAWHGTITAKNGASLEGTDIEVCLDDGAITITPLRVAAQSVTTDEMRARFTRH